MVDVLRNEGSPEKRNTTKHTESGPPSPLILSCLAFSLAHYSRALFPMKKACLIILVSKVVISVVSQPPSPWGWFQGQWFERRRKRLQNLGISKNNLRGRKTTSLVASDSKKPIVAPPKKHWRLPWSIQWNWHCATLLKKILHHDHLLQVWGLLIT